MLQLAIFASISVGALAILMALFEKWAPDRSRIRRRLQGEFAGAAARDDSANLYKASESWGTEFGDDAPGPSNAGRRLPPGLEKLRGRIESYLHEAGVGISPRQLAYAGCGLTLIPGALGLALGGWLAGFAGSAAGVAIPIAAVIARRSARREKYLKQLAGAFELMARVLRTGKSVTESFRAAVEAFEDPLASEFAQCVHQIEHGLRPESAYSELSQRSGILELRIFVIAMTIHRQTGGNLADMLDRLSGIIKARILTRKKLRALTAEGRLQSASLVVLPFLTFAVMYVLNRQYAEKLLENWRLLAATIGCMGIGMAWIRNIMKLES